MKTAIAKGNKGRKAMNNEQCQYLTEDGNKCAVGCFIPDGHRAQASLDSALRVVDSFADLEGLMPLESIGLYAMQRAHDLSPDESDPRPVVYAWIDKHVEDA